MSSWSSVIASSARTRVLFGERLLDPLGEPLRLDRERLDARGEPLRGRRVDAVEREDDREHALRRLDQPLHARERGVGPDDREQACRREAAPALGGLLDPLRGERVRIVGEPFLPAREEPARP